MQRVLTDTGYHGHKLPNPWKFKVFVDGQKRRKTKAIKQLMKRRAAVEAGDWPYEGRASLHDS